MNARLVLTTVTLMLRVPTRPARSPVHVMPDILEVEKLVLVSDGAINKQTNKGT